MIKTFVVAHEYAKAILGVCIEQNTIDKWKLDLELLSRISRNDLIQSLCYRFVESQKISEILIASYEDIRESKIDFYVCNFINFVSRNNRVLLLPVIYTLFCDLYYEYMQSVKIEVISAYRLMDYQLKNIIDAMTACLHKNVHVVCRINTDIFSGIVIRIGDVIIDGSIRGRILRLRNVLMD